MLSWDYLKKMEKELFEEQMEEESFRVIAWSDPDTAGEVAIAA